jgi:hypothetical protein
LLVPPVRGGGFFKPKAGFEAPLRPEAPGSAEGSCISMLTGVLTTEVGGMESSSSSALSSSMRAVCWEVAAEFWPKADLLGLV